jgi:hypothetical protein
LVVLERGRGDGSEANHVRRVSLPAALVGVDLATEAKLTPTTLVRVMGHADGGFTFRVYGQASP